MGLADYAHWNEEAPLVWWAEEGQHDEPPDLSELDDDDYYDDHPPEGCE